MSNTSRQNSCLPLPAVAVPQPRSERILINKTLTKRLAAVLLLLSLSTGGSVASAAKATPSPFAGTWCGPLFEEAASYPVLRFVYQLRIFDNGRIGGGSDGFWQISYSELHVTSVLWPDFRAEHLHAAIRDFASRRRRFGGLDAPGA